MELTQQFKDYILKHPRETKESALKIASSIQHSPLKYEVPSVNGPVTQYTHTLHIPKFFSKEDKEKFEYIVAMTYGIFEKTIDAYKKDPRVRRVFGFPTHMEKLIRKDPGYDTAIPMLRIDIFYDENTKDFQFCEFNTDGTSAMFENDEMALFMKDNNAFQVLNPDVEYMPLVEPWVDAFLEICQESDRHLDHPSIVITDFLENGYTPEFYAFQKAFKDRGLECDVEDIRNLDYDGYHLFNAHTGKIYDVIYRRAVTGDIERRYHDILPFVLALTNQDVLVIGDLQTQIPHSKMISEALVHPDVQKYLTEEEKDFIRKHLPATWNLTSEIVPKVAHDKDRWIIKPKDSYGAKGVWAGIDVPEKLWHKLLLDFADTDYIVQTYIPHFQSENIDPVHEDTFQNYSNLTGLYVYNGKFAGVYSRLSDSGIVSTQYNERMVPTYFEK